MRVYGVRQIEGDDKFVEVLLENGEVHKCKREEVKMTKNGFAISTLVTSPVRSINRKLKRAKICKRCGDKFEYDKKREFKRCSCGMHRV